jgi:hypothetical protein
MHGRWVKPVTTTSAPRVLVTVAYDPLDTPHAGTGWETSAASWSITAYRRRADKWQKLEGRNLTGIDTQRTMRTLLDCGLASSRTYIVSPVASDALTLLGFWRAVESGSCSLRLSRSPSNSSGSKRPKRRPHPLVLSGTPDIVGWEHAGREFRMVSYANHHGVPLADAARHAGFPAPPWSATATRPTGHSQADSAWTAGALSAVYRRLIDWHLAHGCGRWADSVGAAAWSWWRTTLPKKTVLEHDHPEAKATEAASVYGGRVQLFWFGSAGRAEPTAAQVAESPRAVDVHLPQPCYKIDVRSMYASILRDREFPVRLLGRLRVRAPAQLLSACRGCLCVATVRVRLATPSLPYRHQQRGTVYPVGEWWTTLATPEILAASGRGEIQEVGEVWGYQPGRPFAAFASELMRLRSLAVEAGDAVGGTWCKTIANALTGRLSRVRRGWVSEPDKPVRRPWGPWYEVDGDSGDVTSCRGVAGMRQRLLVGNDRPGGLTACYSHCTAYGRVMLAEYMATAGPGQVLWVDTDGLIVTRMGLDRLTAAGKVRADEPGFLRVEGEMSHFAARTPKHYCADGRWTLAGVRGDCGPVEGMSVRSYVTANPVRSGIDPAGVSIPTATRTLRLDAIPLAGTPGCDGWVIPPEVKGGRLYQRRDELPEEMRELADY